jgi:hypothetical protein
MRAFETHLAIGRDTTQTRLEQLDTTIDEHLFRRFLRLGIAYDICHVSPLFCLEISHQREHEVPA